MLLLCNNFVFVFIISIAFFYLKQIETVFFVFQINNKYRYREN